MTKPDWRIAAEHLINSGVPVFFARRAKSWPQGGHDNTGFIFPADWQLTEPSLDVLDGYTPEKGALCAVMGHTVDGLDIDSQRDGLVPDGVMPTSYGRARTPSGGTHDLIESIHVKSQNDVFPGVDLKSGLDDGKKRYGMLFIAPTLKFSKHTGEVGQYVWEVMPDLEMLDLIGDGSGARLAEIASRVETPTSDGFAYDGPAYEDLPAEQQEAAKDLWESALFDWRIKLAEASVWPDGERDEKGRGWESLSRDFAWFVAMQAVCPWAYPTEDEASQIYAENMPDAIASDPKCRKWYNGILDKAAEYPTNMPPWWSSIFFDQTEELRKIRDAAYASLVTPNGMLAVTLGRVLAEVPVTTMLPPLAEADDPSVSSSPASLNIGIAMVASSGGGKSSTRRASRNLLGFRGLDQKNIEKKMGSGEGLVDIYLEPEMQMNEETGKMKATGKKVVIDDPRAIIVSDEVEQMAALGADRKGSSLMSTLRELLTGEPLGQTNAEASGRSRAVPELSYRAVVMVGVQPARSDILLNEGEVAVGTPQRFLWCSMDDTKREIPHPDNSPRWPSNLDWEPPVDWPQFVKYPAHIRKEVREQQWRETRGEGGTGLDGHARLTRLKVAFALAVLHGEVEITDRWWSMAGQVMAMSRETQDRCRSSLAVAVERRETVRAIRAAKASAAADEEVSISRVQRAADSVIARLKKNPGTEFRWSDCKPALRLRNGLETEEIITEIQVLDSTIIIEEYEAQGRIAYKLTYPEGKTDD